jgi:hypothetical protein
MRTLRQGQQLSQLERVAQGAQDRRKHLPVLVGLPHLLAPITQSAVAVEPLLEQAQARPEVGSQAVQVAAVDQAPQVLTAEQVYPAKETTAAAIQPQFGLRVAVAGQEP